MGALRHSPIWSDPRVQPPYGTTEIDWSHPLARGLLFGFLANEGAGKCRDALQMLQPSTRGSVVNPTWVKSAGGSGHQDTNQWYGTGTRYTTPDSISCLLVVHDVLGTSQVPKVVLGVWDGLDVNQKNWRLEMDDSALTHDGFVLKYDGGGRSNFSFNIRRAGLHNYGFTVDNSSDTTSFYRDGAFVETASEVAPYLTTGSNAYPILGASAASTGIANVAAWVWNYALPAGLMAWATAEPYAMLRPVIRRRVSVPAGSASVGSLDYTLAAVTSTATGALALTGSAAVTLAGATVAATGTLPLAGTASVTLIDVMLTGAGAVAIQGALAKTLDAVTLHAFQNPPATGGQMAFYHHHHARP